MTRPSQVANYAGHFLWATLAVCCVNAGVALAAQPFTTKSFSVTLDAAPGAPAEKIIAKVGTLSVKVHCAVDLQYVQTVTDEHTGAEPTVVVSDRSGNTRFDGVGIIAVNSDPFSTKADWIGTPPSGGGLVLLGSSPVHVLDAPEVVTDNRWALWPLEEEAPGTQVNLIGVYMLPMDSITVHDVESISLPGAGSVGPHNDPATAALKNGAYIQVEPKVIALNSRGHSCAMTGTVTVNSKWAK